MGRSEILAIYKHWGLYFFFKTVYCLHLLTFNCSDILQQGKVYFMLPFWLTSKDSQYYVLLDTDSKTSHPVMAEKTVVSLLIILRWNQAEMSSVYKKREEEEEMQEGKPNIIATDCFAHLGYLSCCLTSRVLQKPIIKMTSLGSLPHWFCTHTYIS